jgi:DNA-binding NarL/FixJ family response regulator
MASTIHDDQTVRAPARPTSIRIALRPDARLSRLSRTEYDVARAIVSGLSTREIAFSRERSEHTVNNQIASLFAKLHVGTRPQLVRTLSRSQLDPAESTDDVLPLWLCRAIADGNFELHAEHQTANARHFEISTVRRALSPHYLTVARRCARGDQMKVIAIDLGIAVSNVSFFLERFLAATRVRDRHQLIRLMAPVLEELETGAERLAS